MYRENELIHFHTKTAHSKKTKKNANQQYTRFEENLIQEKGHDIAVS